jgi:hypothetical protein
MEQTILDGSREGSVITFNGTSNKNGLDFSLTNLTLTGGLATSGGGLNISGGHSVKLKNIKIIGNEVVDRGGGIFSDYAQLILLEDVLILDNTSKNEGGGIYYIGGPIGYSYYPMEVFNSRINGNDASSGAGIYANGILHISNSSIENNKALVDGGGIYNIHETNIVLSKINNNDAVLTGGGISSENMDLAGNRLSIAETTIDGNHSKEGAGIYNRGILTLQGSTISNNIADNNGGGIWDGGIGSGINNYLFSINSTISGNQAKHGGGIWGGEIQRAGIFSSHMELINLTIANNTGKGIYTHAGNTSLRNVLLAKNAGGNCDINTDFKQKNSLSDDATCDVLIHADPLIGPLADNGGNTLTHQLLPGSPAIDRAVDTVDLYTDQRDFPRPRDGSWDNISDMDIGSYEADYPTPPE